MANDINLDKMSHDELVAHRKDVDKALKTVETRRRKEALDAAKAAAAEHGMSLKDLMGDGSLSKTKGTKGEPKYRHPENPEKTWTGKGRKPTWIREHEEAGKNVEELAI